MLQKVIKISVISLLSIVNISLVCSDEKPASPTTKCASKTTQLKEIDSAAAGLDEVAGPVGITAALILKLRVSECQAVPRMLNDYRDSDDEELLPRGEELPLSMPRHRTVISGDSALDLSVDGSDAGVGEDDKA